MNRNLIVLSAIALLLGAYVAADWLPGGWSLTGAPSGNTAAQATPASADAAQASLVKLNPLEGLSAESFAAVLEHPLFNPGRAPRPVDPPPPPPPPPVDAPPPEEPMAPAGPSAGDFALLAVAGGPSGHVAALRIAATGEVLYLREGQPVAEWTLISVSDRSVVIGTPENNVTLNLFEAKGPEAAPPSTPDAPPPPPDSMQMPAPPEYTPPPEVTQMPAAGD